jgi:phosphatidylethanolamine-binding protein (PEBP) family uncharacterized protein
MNVKPFHGKVFKPVQGGLFFGWSMAGIDPKSTGIKAGELPKGAIKGINSYSNPAYQICPEGHGESYIFALYALPKKLSPPVDFEPYELRQKVLDVSKDVGLLRLTYTP